MSEDDRGCPIPDEEFSHGETLRYLSGFGNHHESEAIPGALPRGLYRISPSVDSGTYTPLRDVPQGVVSDFSQLPGDPNQLRWHPPPPASPDTDWLDGLSTLCGSGSADARSGAAVHMYSCCASMERALINSDGDLLLVPQAGALVLQTELGRLALAPGEIAVVPRGIAFRVRLVKPEAQTSQTAEARGYVLEVFRGHFSLPALGAIGANGLAAPRDFLYPCAAFEDRAGPPATLVNKFCGRFWARAQARSPFDVVAWHGNYAPYKYDLARFNTMGTVSFDHPDPSIFTVLSCTSDTPGEALADFAIFPPRWMVAEHTFRPPWFHRNVMSEFMGMIHGKYDAKKGFSPGGASLHPCMTAHGPDAATVAAATYAELLNGASPLRVPEKFVDGLAFMFETSAMLKATPAALAAPLEGNPPWRDTTYGECWAGIPRVFAVPSTEIDAERMSR